MCQNMDSYFYSLLCPPTKSAMGECIWVDSLKNSLNLQCLRTSKDPLFINFVTIPCIGQELFKLTSLNTRENHKRQA